MSFFDRFFSQPTQAQDPAHSETLTRLESKLTGVPGERATLLAAYALLLGKVAYADMEITPGERERMGEILRDQLGLPEAQATLIRDLAVELVVLVQIEEHILYRRINELATREEKLKLLNALFHLAADDDITEQESETVWAIAGSLNFSRQEFIAVRSGFREHLRILKGLPGPR